MNLGSRNRRLVHSLRSRLREATADAILAAAEETLAEQGLHEAGMSAIAARAGVSVGTLYNHFSDKGALVVALFRVRRQAFIAALDAALAQAARRPFQAQLRAYVAAMLAYLEAHRAFYKIALESEHDPMHREGRASAMEQLKKRADKLVRRGVQDKILRPDRFGLNAGVLMGILKAVLLRALADERQKPTQLVDHVVDLYLNGTRRP